MHPTVAGWTGGIYTAGRRAPVASRCADTASTVTPTATEGADFYIFQICLIEKEKQSYYKSSILYLLITPYKGDD